jgi:hypothetical protein
MTTLLTKSRNITGAPLASDLAVGNGSTTFGAELAVNTADKKLYVKDSTNAVVEIAGALQAYPVGAVYISVDFTPPSTLFGGTWERFGKGRTLVSLDSEDTDFDTAEETIGAKTHTLSVAEIPSHTHTVSGIENPRGTGSDGSEDGASSFTNSLTTSATGGGQAHNNLQPYVVVYMWKRTA